VKDWQNINHHLHNTSTPINSKPLTFARLEEKEEGKGQPRVTTTSKVSSNDSVDTSNSPKILD